MVGIKQIRVPTPLLFLLSFIVVLLSPLCPVDVQRIPSPSECPAEPCQQYPPSTQLDPPVLVATSGFSWTAHAIEGASAYNRTFSASPAVTILLLAVPVLPPLPFIFREKGGSRWRRLTLTRRYWRAFLWALGLSMLMLSASWAWNYVVFYGGMTTTAVVDPLLVSLLATFMLFGIGLSVMMLAVRSRAIWATRMEEGE